jgi:hypothetical protein
VPQPTTLLLALGEVEEMKEFAVFRNHKNVQRQPVMLVKIMIILVVTPYSILYRYQRFGGTCATNSGFPMEAACTSGTSISAYSMSRPRRPQSLTVSAMKISKLVPIFFSFLLCPTASTDGSVHYWSITAPLYSKGKFVPVID